jgi:predicted AAA+ superfamily ATPase
VNYIEDAYGDRIGLQYLRDKERREVDFVITLKRRPVALIEVKNSYQDLSSSLLYFKKNLGVSSCIQLHADSKRKAMIKNGVKIISIQEFFSSDVSARTFWEVA